MATTGETYTGFEKIWGSGAVAVVFSLGLFISRNFFYTIQVVEYSENMSQAHETNVTVSDVRPCSEKYSIQHGSYLLE